MSSEYKNKHRECNPSNKLPSCWFYASKIALEEPKCREHVFRDKIYFRSCSLHSERQPVIFLSVNFSYADVATTFRKAKLFGTADHANITGPSLCVKIARTVINVIVRKSAECVSKYTYYGMSCRTFQ